MSRPGGRSILAEIGRQLIDMVEDASREFTQPPYARPEEGPPRGRPRPTPPWEVEREPVQAPVDTVVVEDVPRPPRQRELAAVARTAGPGRSIRAQLRSKAGVRRALVLNEILGPPKSMSDDAYR